MKTIVTLVDCESAAWMDGDIELLENVVVGKPAIFPHLSPEEKVALATKILGANLRTPKIFERSTVIGSKGVDDLVALQFFDVDEQGDSQQVIDSLKAQITAHDACEECGGEGCDDCDGGDED